MIMADVHTILFTRRVFMAQRLFHSQYLADGDGCLPMAGASDQARRSMLTHFGRAMWRIEDGLATRDTLHASGKNRHNPLQSTQIDTEGHTVIIRQAGDPAIWRLVGRPPFPTPATIVTRWCS